jgi:GT2 family glycosyltransferase
MKPTYSKASIVIPTFNRRALLQKTLDSLLRMQGIGNCQIIVADDGSSDGTREVVESYVSKLDLAYQFQDDLGFRAAKARNSALQLAKYPLLIFLDCGMLVTASFLAAHLAAHRSTRGPAAVVGYTYGFDRDNENAEALAAAIRWEDLDATAVELNHQAWARDPRDELFQRVADRVDELPAPWTLMWSCNFSVEWDVFRIVNGFNENFVTWGGEDTELAYRLYRCGMTFVFARDATAIHAPHPKNGRALQPSSLENFARETLQYHDPMIQRLLRLGDIVVNQPASRSAVQRRQTAAV